MEFFHENTKTLHINTEPNRNYFIPFDTNQNPFLKREDSNRFFLLNGEWSFSYYNSFSEIKDNLEKYITKKFKDKILVPGNWQLQGYDHPDYVNTRYPIPYDPPYVPDDNPCGIYKRIFNVNINNQMEYLIDFEGVDSCFYLFINDEFTGYSQVAHNTSEFNISKFLHNGKNTITVIVLKWCDGTYLECQDKWRMSGIFRDV
ncbi:MAG: beta-galactosidase, partial [Treponema sp.]|nr:beta-galactosidase [Treponema sp.]